jgi:hypothetical protein
MLRNANFQARRWNSSACLQTPTQGRFTMHSQCNIPLNISGKHDLVGAHTILLVAALSTTLSHTIASAHNSTHVQFNLGEELTAQPMIQSK